MILLHNKKKSLLICPDSIIAVMPKIKGNGCCIVTTVPELTIECDESVEDVYSLLADDVMPIVELDEAAND